MNEEIIEKQLNLIENALEKCTDSDECLRLYVIVIKLADYCYRQNSMKGGERNG